MVNFDEIDIPMDYDDDISEYERIRAQNLKELEMELSEFNEDIDQSSKAINEFTTAPKRVKPKKRKKEGDDETFRFTGYIPSERRKSGRLANVAPKYTYEDLPNDDYKSHSKENDLDDLEEVVFQKRRRIQPRRSISSVPCVAPEDITLNYLKNVAKRSTIKQYSQNGTSCHQCRQKTLDSKTYCRSGRCVGVRGQFCGACLKNRYGEKGKVALLTPNWECPPCRGLCNCSICRTRAGKRPTGILAPMAFSCGYKSVKDFLSSLNGKGDYVTDSPSDVEVKRAADEKKYRCEDDLIYEHLLIGFTKDGRPLWRVEKKEFRFCEEDSYFVGFDSDLFPIMTRI